MTQEHLIISVARMYIAYSTCMQKYSLASIGALVTFSATSNTVTGNNIHDSICWPGPGLG